MTDAHEPGQRPERLPLGDQEVVDMVNRLREGTDHRIDDLLAIYHATTVAARPVLDQLMLRAYPAGTRQSLCSAPVAEQLERIYLTVLEDLDDRHFTEADAAYLHERLTDRASAHLADVLVDITHDVVRVENSVLDKIATCEHYATMLHRRLLSPTSALAHLCEVFHVRIPRTFGEQPNPVDINAPTVTAMLDMLTSSEFCYFLDETRRTLQGLNELTDVARYRAMIVTWDAKGRRATRRPGTGYLTAREMQLLFPSIRSLKVKLAQATGQLADERVGRGGTRPRILTPARSSRTWGAGMRLIQRAHHGDTQI